jgi:hypothetical protein
VYTWRERESMCVRCEVCVFIYLYILKICQEKYVYIYTKKTPHTQIHTQREGVAELTKKIFFLLSLAPWMERRVVYTWREEREYMCVRSFLCIHISFKHKKKCQEKIYYIYEDTERDTERERVAECRGKGNLFSSFSLACSLDGRSSAVRRVYTCIRVYVRVFMCVRVVCVLCC